jgi:hypothetical protein
MTSGKRKNGTSLTERTPPPPTGGTNTAEPEPPAAIAVVQWLVSGASETDVLEALRVKYPGGDARETMAAVRAHFAAEGNPDSDALRGWVLIAYRELYRRMLEVGDFDGARKVLKNITETGL